MKFYKAFAKSRILIYSLKLKVSSPFNRKYKIHSSSSLTLTWCLTKFPIRNIFSEICILCTPIASIKPSMRIILQATSLPHELLAPDTHR